MKKIALFVMTAALVLTTVGCEKISDFVTGKTTNEQGLVDDRGKKLSADDQKGKIEETANVLMADLDKAVWEADYQKVVTTIDALDKKEIDATVLSDKINAIIDLWSTVTGEDPNTVTKTIAKISDFKGHFTENNKGGFDYQEANDLQITVIADGSPVTITYAAVDTDVIFVINQSENGSYVKSYIPKSVITKLILGNDQLAALQVNLDPKDLNNDSVWDEENDKVNVSYSLTVGAYTMKVEQLDYATENAAASVKLLKGKDLVIGISAKATYKFVEENFCPLSAQVTLDLAGKMQFIGNVPDYAKMEEGANNVDKAIAAKDEKAIAEAAAAFEKLLAVGIYYDGKNTLQATLGFEPFKYDENTWDVLPVVRFADGTTYTMEDFTKDQKFQDISNNIMTWMKEMMDYLGISMENNEQ